MAWCGCRTLSGCFVRTSGYHPKSGQRTVVSFQFPNCIATNKHLSTPLASIFCGSSESQKRWTTITSGGLGKTWDPNMSDDHVRGVWQSGKYFMSSHHIVVSKPDLRFLHHKHNFPSLPICLPSLDRRK